MRRIGIILSVILYIMLMSGCGRLLDTELTISNSVERTLVEDEYSDGLEITRHDSTVSCAEATEINLENLQEGKGYLTDGNKLMIFSAGEYLLSGVLADGSIVIDVYDDEVVHLFLNNVQITSGSAPVLYVQSADKVIITALEGTNNIFIDDVRHDQQTPACIFSNADLTINGQGTLQVFGYHEDGVRTKDRLKAVNSVLYVKAKGDGLRGNDGVILFDSAVEIECEKNALFSNSEKDMVVLQGGACKIIAGEHAIYANKKVVIKENTTDMYSTLKPIVCNGVLETEEETTNDK
ncbi:MAG: carbohydrate-binding domain-containing protein [Lachnospiraceae bacterium]|nr:carbohydrate-binding domain-containing protein [Lachnospiraceae bacterium]